MKKWGKRAPVALLVVIACVVAISSCAQDRAPTGAAAAASSYADALARQDAGGAALFTTAPTQANEVLTSTLQAMHADRIDTDITDSVEYSDGTASFSLATTWRWGSGEKERSFATTTSGTARNLSSGWKVSWEPTLLHAGLTAGGQLRQIRTDARPAPRMQSWSGRTLMNLTPVNEIILDPTATPNLDRSVASLVRTLQPIAPLITSSVIKAKLDDAPGRPITAVTLRDSDMEVMTSDPARIAGVTINKTGKLVMKDRRLSSPLATGLTNYWQAVRDATAGWQVQLVEPNAADPRRLAGEQGPASPDIKTTVDQDLQLTLGDAAVEVAQPATILALNSSTGGILAMAQNAAAADRGIGLDEAFPVGATLDPVLTAVRGAADGDEQTKAILDRLGLGVKFTVPGASTPSADDRAAVPIDYQQNSLATASMLNMGAFGVAMARSRAANPTSVAPYILSGVPTKVADGELGELNPQVARSIQRAMADTAEDGDASGLTDAPGLRALVGTNGPQGPGWFVGTQAGKVIVIYTEGPLSGTAALQVAQKYFRLA